MLQLSNMCHLAFRIILSVLVCNIIGHCIPGTEVVDANSKLLFSRSVCIFFCFSDVTDHWGFVTIEFGCVDVTQVIPDIIHTKICIYICTLEWLMCTLFLITF